MLSGRVSYEMVSKVTRTRFALMAAISVPFSLVIHAAKRWNITLRGFVRDDRVTVCSHLRHIADPNGVGDQPAQARQVRCDDSKLNPV